MSGKQTETYIGKREATKNFIRGKICENCNWANYEFGCMSPDRMDKQVGYPWPGSCEHWKEQAEDYKYAYGLVENTIWLPNKLRLRRPTE